MTLGHLNLENTECQCRTLCLATLPAMYYINGAEYHADLQATGVLPKLEQKVARQLV